MADAILAQSGIYQIRNTVNGKLYVGSAVNVQKRMKQHLTQLTSGSHCNSKLARAWVKYGSDSFAFEVIEPVDQKKDLIAREQHWIDHFLSWTNDGGYNICRVAGNTLGTKRTPEACAKIAQKARLRSPSVEVRTKISAALKGRKISAEAIAKSSATRTGKKLSASHVESIRKAQTGKKLSDETRAKVSDALKKQWAEGQRVSSFVPGRKMAPETVEKVAAAHRGMKRSDETKKKISEAAKKRSPEYIQKMAATLTGRKLPAEVIAKREATRRLNGTHIPSEETKKRRSEALKGRKKSPEHIANGVAARRANRLARMAQQMQMQMEIPI